MYRKISQVNTFVKFHFAAAPPKTFGVRLVAQIITSRIGGETRNVEKAQPKLTTAATILFTYE